MKTVGDIFSRTREEKRWSVGELSRRTNIQEHFIVALETSDSSVLSASPFVTGFIRTLAQELDLNPDDMIAVYRRDYSVNLTKIVPSSPWISGSMHRWSWSPATTVVAVLGVFIISFLAYLALQMTFLVRPPRLELLFPKDQGVVSERVLVEGKTDPTAIVTINGKEIQKNQNGVFSTEIELSAGVRIVTVRATGQNRKSVTVERTVTVKTR